MWHYYNLWCPNKFSVIIIGFLALKIVQLDTKNISVLVIQVKIWYFLFLWRPSWILPPGGVSPHFREVHPGLFCSAYPIHLKSTIKPWSAKIGHGFYGTFLYYNSSRPRICLDSLQEHFIFLNFLGGGPQNPPQGEVAAHKYSHHKISNPPFTNHIYPNVNNRSLTV